jgi:hypothetical protein
MPKVADFLKTLLTKAGVNLDQENIKTALAALPPDLELADDVATGIDNGLLSIASAKNNHPDIKKHYTGLALNSLDSELNTFLEGEKLPEEVLAEIKAEQSSYKRAILAARKLKELEGKKAASGDKDKEKYTQQIADLQKELRETKDKEQGIHASYKDQLKNKVRDFHQGTILGGYKTRFDDLDGETKRTVLSNIINKNLTAKGLTLTVDENENLVILNQDGSNAFGEDHRPLTPKLFFDKVMADEKIVVVNDNNNTGSDKTGQNNSFGQQRQNNSFGPNGQYGNNNNHQNNANGNGNGGGKKNTALQSLIGESLNDYNKATANPAV